MIYILSIDIRGDLFYGSSEQFELAFGVTVNDGSEFANIVGAIFSSEKL